MTVRMLINRRSRKILNDQDHSIIGHINFTLKGLAVWMKRYEIFMISGRGASDSLNHFDSVYNHMNVK